MCIDMRQKMKKNVGAIVLRSGVSFRVWAPFATQVYVTGAFNNWGNQPLENEQDGYWWVFVPEAKVGQEYKYVIENGENILRRNDPRAMHLTTSAGTSVIASHKFDWGDDVYLPPPVEQQIIY